MKIPSELTAGNTWTWNAAYGDYPSSTWSATAHFRNAAESFSVSSSASGDGFTFAETAANTAAIKAGKYKVTVRVAYSTYAFTADEGWCEILPDPASGVKTDPRSWARRTLDAVEAFLEGNASTAQQSMSIAGRSISRWSVPELMEWRDRLRAEVRTDERGSAAGLGRDIRVRYGAS